MVNFINLSEKKILQVLPSLDSGGVERGTLEIAEAIINAGGTSLILSNGGRLVEPSKKIGAKHLTAPVHSKNPFRIYKNIFLIYKIIKEQKIDLVHVRSRAPAWSVFFAAKMSRTPFITTFHGTYGHTGLWGLKKYYNKVMLRGKCVIANSNFISSHLKKIYHTSSRFIHTVPRGVDIEKFNKKSIKKAQIDQLLKEWNLKISTPLILMPGRLTRWKGQKIFLQALEKLPHRNFMAVIVGSDQGRTAYRQELEEFIKKHKLQKNIKMVGHCSDMPAAYALANFIVSASTDPEAFGRVLAEAGALEKPVIATDHGGAQEIIIPNKTGFLVTPGCSSSLSKALEKAFNLSKEHYNSMGLNAKNHIIENFSKRTFQNKTLKVYTAVLKKRK